MSTFCMALLEIFRSNQGHVFSQAQSAKLGRPVVLRQVSADGEVALYKALHRANITLLSIAHRPALKRFHSAIIHFEGVQTDQGPGWHLEELHS